MTDQLGLGRNNTEVFARRVRKNLHFIIGSRANGEDVHEVTQLVISLLGIIVFPWEEGALTKIESKRLSDLEKDKWPAWNIELDKKGDTRTLGMLIWHLRNAASHRRIYFSSDDPEMDEVEIIFEDAQSKNSEINWRARIDSKKLLRFCDQFTELLEDCVG